MKDYVIYTAIVGSYDTVRQPLFINEHFDYILFSNDTSEKQIGVWQVRPIPYHNDIQTKIARWVKTHPEELLCEYKSSLWIDANITITSCALYDRYAECLNKQILIASICHPERDCTYDEGAACLSFLIESEKILLPWLRKIYHDGFPSNYGLFETGIMFRNHSESSQLDKFWWRCIDEHSRRDQLSFCYSLWKTGMGCDLFLPKGENSRNSTLVKLADSHLNISKKNIPFTFRNFPFLKSYIKASSCKNPWDMDLSNYYSGFYRHPLPLLHAKLAGIKYLLIWICRKTKESLFAK